MLPQLRSAGWELAARTELGVSDLPVPPMSFRSSQIRQRLAEGIAAHGLAIRVKDDAVFEFAAMLGFDALWLDLEHHCVSVETAAAHIRAARAGGVADVIARPGNGEFARAARLLEAGARGIMYPRCESAEEAAELVGWTRFPPQGHRGLDGVSPDNPFGLTPAPDYLRRANEEIVLIVQIESPNALSNIDAIAATPGIDFLMLGPGDYAAAIGVPSQMNHPEVVAAHDRVRDAARRAGRRWAVTCFDLDHARRMREQGADLLFHGSDWRILSRAMQALVAEARAIQ